VLRLLKGTGRAPKAARSLSQQQVCDAPKCSGPHTHYTGELNEYTVGFSSSLHLCSSELSWMLKRERPGPKGTSGKPFENSRLFLVLKRTKHLFQPVDFSGDLLSSTALFILVPVHLV